MGRDRAVAPPSTSARSNKLPTSPWPDDVRYLEILEYDEARIPRELLEKYRPSGRHKQRRHLRADVRRLARPVQIDDASHPAHGQRGLFAVTKIQPRERIVDYHGVVTRGDDCSQTSDYTLAFGEKSELAIDAERAGNEARFVNDFRNTGKRANAYFDTYVDDAGDLKLAVFCLPSGPIKSGEEILISYGKSFWKHRFGDLESFRTDI